MTSTLYKGRQAWSSPMVEGYATTFNEVATRALITHEDKVLLVYEGHLDQWWLPGGRIKPGEPMLDGLAREIEEETALSVTLGDLATFFDVIVPVRAQGCNKHIFHFVFHGTPDVVPDFIERAHVDTDPDHPGKVSKMRWFTAAEIAAMNNVYPPFLKDWPALLVNRPKAYYGVQDGYADGSAVEKFHIAARVIATHEKHLLMLYNGTENYWFGPGGRIEYGEAIMECAAREVFEETGLTISAGNIIAVDEVFNSFQKVHRINLYTRCELENRSLPASWKDLSATSSIKEARFFDRKQLAALPRAYPLYMAELAWPETVQEKVEA